MEATELEYWKEATARPSLKVEVVEFVKAHQPSMADSEL